MDRKGLLGASFDCNCGRHHEVPTSTMIYRPGALDALAETALAITPGKRFLIISDTRTWEKAGVIAEEKLASSGRHTACFIVPDTDGETPVADDVTRDYILENAPDADLYLAAGSGVINDLVKWVAYLKGKPYISIPTAASMNGYASANVAATVDGLKVLFHAEACRAVIADPEIINNAPGELTASGLGDVLAKSVSSADWKLNQFLFKDYYCQYSVDLLKDLEPVYLNNPDKIRDREATALKALFEALFYSSIAMTMTGTSSPASGGEHLISHSLDMLAGRDGVKHDLHGRQVGIGSILTAAIYERVMMIDNPRFREFPAEVDSGFWGSLTPIVEKEYQMKTERAEEAAALLKTQENWQRLKQLIQPGLVSAAKLKGCLQRAGAAHRYSDIRYDNQPLSREFFIETALHAHQMRSRFTVLDLAVMLGILPDCMGELVDNWVA